MTQYSIYGQNRRNMETAVENRETFSTSGSFRGQAFPITPYVGMGQLNESGRGMFEGMRETIDYIVFSYNTPIAWHTRDGHWWLVSQEFSATTARHQSAVRAGIGYSTEYMPV